MFKNIKEAKKAHSALKKDIKARLGDFRRKGKTSDGRELFEELAFCLFTPQSKAKSCWAAVNELKHKNLLLTGSKKKISESIKNVRFRHNKAGYLVEARRQLLLNNMNILPEKISGRSGVLQAREWLVNNIKGLGYKEASHFLRNTGHGRDIAILDRHILKNLASMGVIRSIPKTITKQKYLSIENKMRAFARKTGIPLDHMDMLFWHAQTGEIFK